MQNLMVTTNHKPIINIHTKRKRNPNIALKIISKSEEERTIEERGGGVGKDIQKQFWDN